VVVAKVVPEVIFASKWGSGSLARVVIAWELIFQFRRAVDIAVVSLEVRRSLENPLLKRGTTWVLAREDVLLGITMRKVSRFTTG
jgi:hypothetical protein